MRRATLPADERRRPCCVWATPVGPPARWTRQVAVALAVPTHAASGRTHRPVLSNVRSRSAEGPGNGDQGYQGPGSGDQEYQGPGSGDQEYQGAGLAPVPVQRVNVAAIHLRRSNCRRVATMDVGDEKRDPLLVFELIAKLGEGAYGSVVKARHRRTNVIFAIKYARTSATGARAHH